MRSGWPSGLLVGLLPHLPAYRPTSTQMPQPTKDDIHFPKDRRQAQEPGQLASSCSQGTPRHPTYSKVVALIVDLCTSLVSRTTRAAALNHTIRYSVQVHKETFISDIVSGRVSQGRKGPLLPRGQKKNGENQVVTVVSGCGGRVW